MVNHGSFTDSVLPVVEAGLAKLVADDAVIATEVAERVFLRAAPGHCVGHVCVHAEAGARSAIVAGDALHHPIQFDLPDLVLRADAAPGEAIRTRRSLMELCAGSSTVLVVGHIPHWTIGRGVPHGDRFRLHDASAQSR